MALLDRIKFDGPPDVLVWKWPSEELPIGSQLIVNESQEALFFKSGQALDLFGPGTHTLTTGNLPFLQRIVNLPFGGRTPFSAEVYFVSKSVALGQDWGTKTPFMVLDPKYRVSVPIRAYGQHAMRVTNAREFIVQIAGASGGGVRGTTANDTARNLLESLIITCVQQVIGDHLNREKASVLDLPSQVITLATLTRDLLLKHYQTFGVEMVNFALESVNFDAEDESVKSLRAMLSEGARMEYMGNAFRRNEDFYRAERQFDVLETAGTGGGAAGAMMGAAMGVGMGFGVATPAGQLAKDSMSPSPARETNCAKCGGAVAAGSKFCNKCGEKLDTVERLCPSCSVPNVGTAKFCAACGTSLSVGKCQKCGAVLPSNAQFCNQCGEKV
jgi:membrane protease subunit (stomatin/prohibitin family)